VPSSPVKRSRLVVGDEGISVEQSARRLQVSPPTIRKWIGEGLLDAIPGREPVEVDPRSVVTVERVLENVKKSYPSREWTRALAAFLHDRDLAQTLGVVEAIEEAERGEYVDR
jgi:transposase